MKIAVIAAVDMPSTKANSVQVMKTCQALIQLGHTVLLFLPTAAGRAMLDDREADTLRQQYGLSSLPEIAFIQAKPGWKRYDFAWKAVEAAQKWGAEMVETWLLQAAVLAPVRIGRVLLELHGPPEGLIGPWLFRLFLRLPGEKSLLLITHGLNHILEESYGRLDRVRPIVFPNGVDLERYKPAEVIIKEPSAPVQVVYTGHLYEGRGMQLMADLARNFPMLQFTWIGGHEADVSLWRRRLESDGLTNVELTGFIPNAELPRYQSSADILLMPYEKIIRGSSGGNSAAYCSPMKMFEYMASARAIIASDLPVLREILNENNSILCPPEDLDAWSLALERLANDPGLRQKLGNQAQYDVQAFTWKARLETALKKFTESDL